MMLLLRDVGVYYADFDVYFIVFCCLRVRRSVYALPQFMMFTIFD